MPKVKFYTGIDIPLEFHRARIVQKVRLLPIDERYEALKKGGFNTYRMDSADVYLDMLTDSGTASPSNGWRRQYLTCWASVMWCRRIRAVPQRM